MTHPTVFGSSIVDETPVTACHTYTFPHCWVHVSLDGRWVETVFHDGTKVTAMPENTEEQARLAEKMGYGDDVAAMVREHEILHTYLALRLRGGASPTLWAVAHEQEGNVAPIWEQEYEEAAVLAFQAYLNDRPTYDKIALDGLPLARIKGEALTLLRP